MDQGTRGNDGMTEEGDEDVQSGAKETGYCEVKPCGNPHTLNSPFCIKHGGDNRGAAPRVIPAVDLPPGCTVQGDTHSGSMRAAINKMPRGSMAAKACPPAEQEVISNAARYGGWAVDEFIADFGLGFRLGNVVKYVSRAGKKDGCSVLEDLRKARVYLDRHIARLESGEKVNTLQKAGATATATGCGLLSCGVVLMVSGVLITCAAILVLVFLPRG